MFRRRRSPNAPLVIVGLGNPGPGYARTRHNAGAELVTLLADRHGAKLERAKGQARSAGTTIEGRRVVLAIPTTFMNECGRAVARLIRKSDAGPEDLIVCHDELDLAPGVARIKSGGGTAGHNGLRSIEASLRSRDFLRVRIGVGKPPSKFEGTDHVLSKMTPEDREAVDAATFRAADAIVVLIREGLDAAQNYLHAPSG